MRALIALALVCTGLAIAADPAFEVASVRRADAETRGYSCSGGPQTPSPERYTCTGAPLGVLISDAYGTQFYQVEGLPDWANLGNANGYTVSANVPEGTTREQFRLMLQALLKERFGLQAAWQKLPRPGWFLISTGRPRLVPAKPDSKPSLQPTIMNGRVHLIVVRQPLASVADVFTIMLHAPVTDETGIKGDYDFTLDFATEWLGTLAVAHSADDTTPTLPTVINQELGLKLERRVVPQDVLVITHVKRDPGAN